MLKEAKVALPFDKTKLSTRVDFVNQKNKLQNKEIYLNKIWLSDKAHFHLNVNHQLLGRETLSQNVHQRLYSQSLTVRCTNGS